MKDLMEIDPGNGFTFLWQPKNEGSNGDWPWWTIYIPTNQRMKDLMEINPDTRFTYPCKSMLLEMNPYDGLYSSGFIEMKVQMDFEPWIIMLYSLNGWSRNQMEIDPRPFPWKNCVRQYGWNELWEAVEILKIENRFDDENIFGKNRWKYWVEIIFLR